MRKENGNIYLIGFMGTGKSSVAKYLRSNYAMDIAEMDEIIEKRENKRISDIFAEHGEEYFRELETALLLELQSKENLVVSCGGGAALRQENVNAMKKGGRIVWLTARPETVYERVKENEERPLLKNDNSANHLAEMMERRRPRYESAADLVVATDEKSIAQICEELMAQLAELDGK
jgi:shikimate kinase